eukprot:1517884-Prymnesium_polylepis.1
MEAARRPGMAARLSPGGGDVFRLFWLAVLLVALALNNYYTNLLGDYEIGEKVYWAGEAQTFNDGMRLVYGQLGE